MLQLSLGTVLLEAS